MILKRIYAVLTGDVIGSRRLESDERLRLLAVLTDSGDRLRTAFPQSILFAPDIFRGDSWQFISSDPAASLRQGLYFRARVKGGMASTRVDMRFSLGLGSIDFLPPEGPSTGAGQAFNLSGQGLDEMDRNMFLALDFPPQFNPELALTLKASATLIDRIAQGWTDRQALAISGALLGLTQARIAEKTFDGHITQQAVAQHLASAGWASIQAGLAAFELVVAKWLEK